MTLREDCYRAFDGPHPPSAVVDRVTAGMEYHEAWDQAHVDLVLDTVADWCDWAQKTSHFRSDVDPDNAEAKTVMVGVHVGLRKVAAACRGETP